MRKFFFLPDEKATLEEVCAVFGLNQVPVATSVLLKWLPTADHALDVSLLAAGIFSVAPAALLFCLY